MAALRPGVNIQVLTTSPPRSAPTDTGVWFVTGITEKGQAGVPLLIRSMSDYATYLGARVSYGILYDALDLFFREGGSSVYVSRVVGPSPVTATHTILDSGSGVSLNVSAIGPGVYGNSLKYQITAGVVSGYRLKILDASNVLLEDSGDLTTQQDAINWSQQSQYVRVTIGATALVPAVVAATALAGGTDDHANIVDAQWLAALNIFTKDLGPGNVSAPGRTSDIAHTNLADHAAANNRVALLDAPDTFTAATLTTSATNGKTTGNGQYAALFAPWIVVPGVVVGTTRTIPPSALVAGKTAAVDQASGSGTAAAGSRGISSYGTAVSQAGWDDTTRDSLNTAGVNAIRFLNGAVTIYGWRSLADPINNPYWVPLGTVRYLMGLAARCYVVGQQFIFSPIDGQGHTISAYTGALTALCAADWNAGDIYGLTPDQAFNVDTGAAINTPTVLAANELRAAVSVRPSPMAELVTIQIVNTPITQQVSA